jgi:hypothetical protein
LPWRGEGYTGEVPTLGYEVASWIQSYCVVPDRDQRGEPFVLSDEQLRFLCYFYALTPEGAWLFQRGAQLVRPQKWGKGPLAAAFVCAEAAGPVLFAGWDAAGEPVGRAWATPHIQITACSEDQTANTWRALQPMLELGPLREWIPDSGLTRINLPGGGLVEPVTASARSRLGQRISFAVQDQTESWVRSNNGHWLADNQRRNLAGMGGRFLETCNAPDPVEQSVATRTPQRAGHAHRRRGRRAGQRPQQGRAAQGHAARLRRLDQGAWRMDRPRSHRRRDRGACGARSRTGRTILLESKDRCRGCRLRL